MGQKLEAACESISPIRSFPIFHSTLPPPSTFANIPPQSHHFASSPIPSPSRMSPSPSRHPLFYSPSHANHTTHSPATRSCDPDSPRASGGDTAVEIGQRYEEQLASGERRDEGRQAISRFICHRLPPQVWNWRSPSSLLGETVPTTAELPGIPSRDAAVPPSLRPLRIW